MRLHRFFVNNGVFEGKNFALGNSTILIKDKELIHQLKNVFRYKAGQNIILFNGTGFDYIYKIIALDKNKLELNLCEKKENKISNKNLILAFSLIKKQNLELILQKGTELGVSVFCPIFSKRTKKKSFDFNRAKKIIIEATEQSGRDLVPQIEPPLDFDGFVKVAQNTGRVCVFDLSGQALNDFKKSKKTEKTIFMIGPEGGFDESELQIFKQNKFEIYKITDSILRAETAAIIASFIG